jgi:hypothetical protein
MQMVFVTVGELCPGHPDVLDRHDARRTVRARGSLCGRACGPSHGTPHHDATTSEL